MLIAIRGLNRCRRLSWLVDDRTVNKDRGIVSKMVAWPAGRAKWLKVVIGLALIYARVMRRVHIKSLYSKGRVVSTTRFSYPGPVVID